MDACFEVVSKSVNRTVLIIYKLGGGEFLPTEFVNKGCIMPRFLQTGKTGRLIYQERINFLRKF